MFLLIVFPWMRRQHIGDAYAETTVAAVAARPPVARAADDNDAVTMTFGPAERGFVRPDLR